VPAGVLYTYTALAYGCRKGTIVQLIIGGSQAVGFLAWADKAAHKAFRNQHLPRYGTIEDQRLYRERIVTDPRILSGKPVVKGTRIAVDLVLEELSHNPDITELLAAHPDLSRTDVQACLAYAQALVTGEDVSPKPLGGGRTDAAL
jgi:uncharacterized protein (DUF433 family)